MEKNLLGYLESLLGVIILVPIVALVICCLTPCCLIYKKRHERRNQRQPTVTTTVDGGPQQPLSPSGYQLFHPGYQPVSVLPGFGNSTMPTAPPPSYLEATDPAQFPAPFTQGHPMYPFQPPGEPNGPPRYLAEFAQHPYNPSHGSTPY